jgi:hypothetical protein
MSARSTDSVIQVVPSGRFDAFVEPPAVGSPIDAAPRLGVLIGQWREMGVETSPTLFDPVVVASVKI